MLPDRTECRQKGSPKRRQYSARIIISIGPPLELLMICESVRRLIAEARDLTPVGSLGRFGGQIGTEAGFLLVLNSPLLRLSPFTISLSTLCVLDIDGAVKQHKKNRLHMYNPYT
jgi:hypothetical protein